MANFAPIRDVPLTGLSEWEASLLNTLKENVEVLTGARQVGVHAVTNDRITLDPLGAQQMSQISADGTYFTLTGSDVPALTDYVKLMTDVQKLANDLYETRTRLNSLLSQLKG